MNIVLIAGLWLDSTAWDEVARALSDAGHNPIPVSLPGQGDGSAAATLDDQIAAVTNVLDGCSGPALLVGHSAACTLAWLAADARPEKTATAVMIGGFPQADGAPYADFFPYRNGAMPFPGWQEFAGDESADLDEPTKRRLAHASIPVPAGVAKGTVKLSDPRRYEIPVVLVCPEFSVDEARECVEQEVVELQRAKQVRYVNVESGHWPMFTQPARLAELLAEVAAGL